jgi:HEAT repeat protein
MADDAWHSLVEAGPTALPDVVRAFDAAGDPSVKVDLAQIISEYRSSDSVPLLETLLRNPDGDLWKQALDGLVMIGGKTALDALAVAKVTMAPEKREWIDEAIAQIIEGQKPG